jgi:hypothetical protein
MVSTTLVSCAKRPVIERTRNPVNKINLLISKKLE